MGRLKTIPADPQIVVGYRRVSVDIQVEEGVSLERFARRFSERLQNLYQQELGELVELGLVEMLADRVRLTPRGRLLGNEVFERFLA